MTASSSKPPLKELSFLQTATRAMLGPWELDQIMYVILSGMTHGAGLGFNRAFLFLADEGRRELRASIAAGPADDAEADRVWQQAQEQELDLEQILEKFAASAEDHKTRRLSQRMAGFVLPLSATTPVVAEGEQDIPIQTLILRCAQQQKPFFSNTIKAVYPPLDDSAGEPVEFSNLALVPLLLRDELLGVILADNCYNQREILEEEMCGLVTLGNLASLAIENARLLGRLDKMAVLDGLTGVFNRRHYEMQLEQEISQACRADRSLSLVLFDIDRFKDINDRYGYGVGDKVLKDMAVTLCEHLRDEDMVARYGGGEFVVLLTGGATSEESLKVAEKLHAKVVSTSIGERPAGEITVCGGVARLDAKQLEGAKLFRMAEEAMRKAKQEGRNRVILAGS